MEYVYFHSRILETYFTRTRCNKIKTVVVVAIKILSYSKYAANSTFVYRNWLERLTETTVCMVLRLQSLLTRQPLVIDVYRGVAIRWSYCRETYWLQHCYHSDALHDIGARGKRTFATMLALMLFIFGFI